MKFLVKSLFIFSSLLLTQQLKAEESYSFGVGLGATYSGLGVNMSMLSDSDMKYLSVGCLGYGGYSGFTCGAGLGWIKPIYLILSQTNMVWGYILVQSALSAHQKVLK